MPRILLINPNTSERTTEMMVAIARAAMPADVTLHGVTAQQGVPMITTAHELALSAAEAVDCLARAGATGWDGVLVACFGDPGIDRLRGMTSAPVLGICEASLQDAAQGGRRFGIVTTTPDLADAIEARVTALELRAFYAGLRTTPGDPFALVGDPGKLAEALAIAARQSVERDGALAVVIGGGPLGEAAAALEARFSLPVVSPIASAARRLSALIDATAASAC